MKKTLLLTLSAIYSMFTIAQTHADFLMKKMREHSDDYVSVVAHRGDWRGAPENSLQAFRNCIKMGVDMIELDIKKSSDGVLFVMHDTYLDRTTNGNGLLSSKTSTELKALNLKMEHQGWTTRHQIPTLEEVLNLCKGKILIQIDGAYPYFNDIIKLTKKTGTEGQVVLKFGEDQAKVQSEHGTALDKTLMMSLMSITSNTSADFIRNQAKLNPLMMEVNFGTFNQYSQPCLDLLKELDIKVMANSIGMTYCDSHDDDRAVELNQPDEAWGFLIDMGARAIQTDRPAELLAYLKDRGLRHNVHDFQQGECVECGFADPDYVHMASDGFYEVGTAEELLWLEKMVERNQQSRLNVRLCNDIDLTGIDFDGIGGNMAGATGSFAGTFDGQGHSITGLNINATMDETGLFGALYGTVRNLKVSGMVTAKAVVAELGGIAGMMQGGRLEHVECDITLSSGTYLCSHVGGIAGSARSNAVITDCTFSGRLTVGISTDCIGGVAGYSNGATIENCLNSGRISTSSSNTSNFIGGILGYCNTTNMVIQNNLSVGRNTAQRGAAIVGSVRAQLPRIYRNNYWKQSTANYGYGSDVAMPDMADNTYRVSTTQLSSGEVAVNLNNVQEDTHWYQTLPDDANPVLDSTHKMVYVDAEGNYHNSEGDPDAIASPSATKDEGAIYNLAGRRSMAKEKGVKITKGKKVLR